MFYYLRILIVSLSPCPSSFLDWLGTMRYRRSRASAFLIRRALHGGLVQLFVQATQLYTLVALLVGAWSRSDQCTDMWSSPCAQGLLRETVEYGPELLGIGCSERYF